MPRVKENMNNQENEITLSDELKFQIFGNNL